jgi:RNA polymerase sigma factor (sigma-70 family)
MGNASMTAALRQVDRLFRDGTLAGLTDDRLLDRFLEHGDEEAFAALVARHGPMVLTACQAALRDPASADDAFQATFLALMRQAGSIRRRECIGGWLRRVARRSAIQANTDALRRRKGEQIAVANAAAATESPVGACVERDELTRAVGSEIDRLPEPYRRAVVLCLIDELPQQEVADRLRVTEGVIRGRLSRARALLRERLTRRGLASAALAATGNGSPHTSTGWASAVRTVARAIAARCPALGGWAVARAGLGAAVLFVICASALVGGVLIGTKPPYPTWWPIAADAAIPVQALTAPARVDGKPEADSGQSIILRGNVLGPDGQPVAGARLHLVADAWSGPVDRGTTRPDGSYELRLPEETFRHNFDNGNASPRVQVALIATAEGLGAGWLNLTSGQRDGKPAMGREYTHDFHLAGDHPITGRVVGAGGIPVSGAVIAVNGIRDVADGRWAPILAAIKSLDPGPLFTAASHPNNWSYPMNMRAWEMIAPATTDADGRFRITGVGPDRWITLRVTGPGVQPVEVAILTREDVDDLARTSRSGSPKKADFGYVLFGPSPTIEVTPARTIAGAVRDAGTGDPITSVRLGGVTAGNAYIGQMNIDAHGRYRGVRSDSESVIWVYALFDRPEPYLSAVRRFANAAALGEIVADFNIVRGVLVTGRVLESATGRPIISAPRDDCGTPGALLAGNVFYFPLSTNTALLGTPAGMYFEGPPHGEARSLTAEINGDGVFRIAVPPGPGVLVVKASPGLPVPWTEGEAKESTKFRHLFPYRSLTFRTQNDGAPASDTGSLPGFAGRIPLAPYHAYHVINTAADAATFSVELRVRRSGVR